MMRPTTLRTGTRVYKGLSNSPNWKGATAVRPQEALQGVKVKDHKRAILRRLQNGR